MQTPLRRLFFWAHLVVGLVAGLVILSMAVSGLIIAYEVQLQNWANHDLRVTPPSANAAPLDAETLLTKAREAKPDLQPSAIAWKSDPNAPVMLSIGREGHHYVNPYTGAYLGEGNKAWHDFFHAVIEWHRFLAGTGLSRETGKAITGAAALLFGFLLISGIYLWWPRHWRWSNLRAITVFNPKLKGRARDWNWHNVIGFWSAFPLLPIILTGLIISYTWANNLLFHISGNEPPPPRARSGPGSPGGPPNGSQRGPGNNERGGPRREGPQSPTPSLVGVSPLITQIRQQKDWQTLNLRMPQRPGDAFTVLLDRGGRGQPHLRTTLQLDPAKQEIQTSPDDFTQQNRGRQWRMYARYLHTGELFGFIGQTIAALSTLAAAMLVWTGFALAWRRFFGKPSKKPASTLP